MSKYDLRQRTFAFSVSLARFINSISFSNTSAPLLNQLLRSGTSIGANIEEADSSPTRKDFKYKLTIAKKESAETEYWLKIIIEAGIFKNKVNLDKAKALLDESEQLTKIISTIIRNMKQ